MNTSPSRFDVIGQLGALRRYARSLTRDGIDAENLVQDSLARLFSTKRRLFMLEFASVISAVTVTDAELDLVTGAR